MTATEIRNWIASHKAVLAAALIANTREATDPDAQRRSERTIEVIVDSLDRALPISPSAPKIEVLDHPFPILRFTGDLFDSLHLMIRSAEDAGDLNIAGWLHNLDGQFTAELRVTDILRARRSHVAGSARGGTTAATNRSTPRRKAYEAVSAAWDDWKGDDFYIFWDSMGQVIVDALTETNSRAARILRGKRGRGLITAEVLWRNLRDFDTRSASGAEFPRS